MNQEPTVSLTAGYAERPGSRAWGLASLCFLVGYTVGTGNWPRIQRFGQNLIDGLGYAALDQLQKTAAFK